ncbi:MAG: protein kinase [Planctomycetes bacterium]|nr:protein kinase [Planctomycetota bacterium]
MAEADPPSTVERTQRLTEAEREDSNRPADLRDTVRASGSSPHARKIGPYTLLEELGRGANGIVYLAQRNSSKERVAVKILVQPQDEEAVVRFRREAATTSRIQDPGIVRTLDFGQDGSRLYYAMEYCPGETLKDRLRAGPLPPREAASLIAGMARAMAAAHQWGVIHRDLKPSNVLIDKESGRPRITDFGLARDYVQQRMTRTGDILGTPVYMAPEQIHGKSDLDHRVDIYALGAILYQLLSGQIPFNAPTIAALAKHIESGRVTPLRDLVPNLSPALIAICARAMAVQRNDRYATASALADALEGLLNEGQALRDDAEEGSRPPLWAWGAVVLAVLSSLVVVLLLATRPSGPSAEPARGSASEESLERVRAETLRSAQAAEVRRVLQEVDLQEQAGVAGPILLRQLGRALEIATGEETAAIEAKLAEIEAETQRLIDAQARLAELERRNQRLGALEEITAQLKAFAVDHPPAGLPKDLKKRYTLLKGRVAGRSVLLDYVQSMSDPPELEQLTGLIRKASEWTPFSPLLGKEANQHALRVTDKLLAASRDRPEYRPTLLILRGLIQRRLGDEAGSKQTWGDALSGQRHSRREVVRDFMGSGLLTATETDALIDAVRGGH